MSMGDVHATAAKEMLRATTTANGAPAG